MLVITKLVGKRVIFPLKCKLPIAKNYIDMRKGHSNSQVNNSFAHAFDSYFATSILEFTLNVYPRTSITIFSSPF